MKRVLVYLLILIALMIGLSFISGDTIEINNFDECVEAGNPVMESYPRQCRANGITFVEDIINVSNTR